MQTVRAAFSKISQHWRARALRRGRNSEIEPGPKQNYFKNLVFTLLLLGLAIILIGSWAYCISEMHFKRNGYIEDEARTGMGVGEVLSSHNDRS